MSQGSSISNFTSDSEGEMNKAIRRTATKEGRKFDVWYQNKCETSEPHPFYGPAMAGGLHHKPLKEGLKWFIWEVRTRSGSNGSMREIEEKYIDHTSFDITKSDKAGKRIERIVIDCSKESISSQSSDGSVTPTQMNTGRKIACHEGYDDTVMSDSTLMFTEEEGRMEMEKDMQLMARVEEAKAWKAEKEEALARERKTIGLVREVREKEKAHGAEDVDQEMCDTWMESMEEKEWDEMVAEIQAEVRGEGEDEGNGEEIRKELEKEIAEAREEINREKRKRTINDVGVKDSDTTGQKRIIKNTKRAIISSIAKGMLASKYANVDPKVDVKGKGKEVIRSRTPGKGGPSKTVMSIEERIERMERRMNRQEGEIIRLEREVRYWKGVFGEMEEPVKAVTKEAKQPARSGNNIKQTIQPTIRVAPALPRGAENTFKVAPKTPVNAATPATGSNKISINYADVVKQAVAQPAWTTVNRERENKEKAKKAYQEKMIKAQKEREEKNRAVIVLDHIPKEKEGGKISKDQLMEEAVELGVDRNDIAEIDVTRKGAIKITVKEPEHKERIVAKLAGNSVKAKTLDRWAGIVIHGWQVTEWKGKMGELKSLIEGAWGVPLMKEPRWLARVEDIKHNGRAQAIVVHVAKTTDRDNILKKEKLSFEDTEGYTVTRKAEGYGHWMRAFTENGMSNADRFCTSCRKTGHGWWQCRGTKVCGECNSEGHTSWDHKMRGIRGTGNKGIRILQHNCNRSTNVMQCLMEDGEMADIIAIQEPWIGNKNRKKQVPGTVEIGNNQLTVGHNGYDIYYKQGQQNNTARVMWMVKKDSGLKWTIRDDLWDHWDASVIDINLTKDRILRIINIYNQEHGKREGWCLKDWPAGISSNVDLMVIGDFNAAGALWDDQRESRKEDMVMHMVDSEELVLLNEANRITWKRNGKESVLDLAWVGENMERKCNWRIVEEKDSGSDHAIIEITYLQEAERVLNPLGKRWNLKQADWKGLQEEVNNTIDQKELAWQEAVEGCDIDKIAKILEESVTDAMGKCIPTARMSWKSKNWFDKEVREKRKEVGKYRRWAKQDTKWKEKEMKEWKEKRNNLFKTIRKKKKAMWNNWISDAKNPKEMWAIWRMLNNRIYTKMPTLKQQSSNESARSFTEKEALLRKQLFPPAPANDEVKEQPGKEKGGVRVVSMEEVTRAIESQGNQKAPGPDGIPIEVIKKLDDKFRVRLREGLNVMIQEGRHPHQWRKAIGAIIPKPGKGDYTTPRSYRPISLLNTLGKVLEKIVAERITEHVEGNRGLHDWQWGGRKERGAEECVEWALDWARTKQKLGKKVAIIAADIDQAFPNVAKTRLGNRLRQNKLEEELVSWVEEFMEEREVMLRFDGKEADWHQIETGIPQGSPISPLLFNVYIAPLLQHLEKFIDEKCEDDIIVPTFIDDVTLVVAGDTWEEVMERGEATLREANAWANRNDIKFAEDKLEWIRLGREEDIEEEEEIDSGSGSTKKESKLMRWLGVWIDRKLDFKSHVGIKVKKAEAVTQRIGRLARGEEGCGVGNLRKMYVACARSVMDYGSRIWWAGQKGLAQKLDRADEKAMRKIGGHLRTAPGGAIRVENDIVPTELRLNERQERIVIRTMNKQPSHPMRRVLREAIRKQKGKKEKKMDEEWSKRSKKKGKEEVRGGIRGGCKRIGKKIGEKWEKIEKSEEGEKRERKWEKEVREDLVIVVGQGEKEGLERMKRRKEEKEEVVMYTDGSKKEGKVGVGVCRIDRWGQAIWEGSYGMGNQMEIMDAEMVGIRKAVEQGIVECREKGVNQLVIRTDSQGAMTRVKERKRGPGEMMAHKIRWQIHAAKMEKITTTFEWVKAHANIAGNERADRLAKKGCNEAKNKEWFISLAYLATEARNDIERGWSKQWETDPRKGKNYDGSPHERKKVQYEGYDRNQVIISRLRTGHVWINKYKKRIQQSETDECECGQGVQDVEHILESCGFTVDARNEAEEKMEREVGKRELLYSQEGIEHAIKIWREFKIVRRSANEAAEERDRELEWGFGDLER